VQQTAGRGRTENQTMLKPIVVALFCIVCIAPAFAGEYTFCLLANKVADGGKLKEYSNKQIENGLCMTSKEILSAITNNDSFKQEICTTAAEHMMREFKKRFPNRPAKDVIGKC
jgi:hypothetical protein